MRYFNGFSLKGEEPFFDAWLLKSEFCVAGFSYGAQQALEYVHRSTKRVDRLMLFSPAFFQTQKASFIRAQLRYFEADNEAYTQQFLKNTAAPSCTDLASFLHTGSRAELEALLTYRWEKEKLEAIRDRGTVIEVFLGTEDRIVDTEAAFGFFSDTATCYLIKNAGHLLKA